MGHRPWGGTAVGVFLNPVSGDLDCALILPPACWVSLGETSLAKLDLSVFIHKMGIMTSLLQSSLSCGEGYEGPGGVKQLLGWGWTARWLGLVATCLKFPWIPQRRERKEGRIICNLQAPRIGQLVVVPFVRMGKRRLEGAKAGVQVRALQGLGKPQFLSAQHASLHTLFRYQHLSLLGRRGSVSWSGMQLTPPPCFRGGT